LIGFVSLDFGLTTVSSSLRILLEMVRDQAVPNLANVDKFLAILLAKVQSRNTGRFLLQI
jgi:hypothetical protein